MGRRIAIIGGGVSGLGAAWALNHYPDRFDFRLFEAKDRVGGNAVMAEMPQEDGSSIPFDIAVTAIIPSVYRHLMVLLERFGLNLLNTRFNYSVRYRGRIYAHDFDSNIRTDLQGDIDKFQRILNHLRRVGWLSRVQSPLLNFLNPYNYISMGTLLNLTGLGGPFRFQVLKPMFINFVLSTNVFDMPASLFARYLEFFDIESATPMQTFDGGTQRIYEHLTAGFKDKIFLNRPVRKVYRHKTHVVVEDEDGKQESYDEVIFACNANQTLMLIDRPTGLERYILSSIRYESELHNHAIVHYDESVLPDNEVKPLTTRSNHIEQYGIRPDNYEITHIMHNQQPRLEASDKPCLVTYNANSPIDPDKIVGRWWFQHVVHDIRQVVRLVPLFRYIQGKRRTWHCGAHTLVNSQETCLITGLAAAHQLGADYPFDDPEARRTFNYYGKILHGLKFRKVRSPRGKGSSG